MARMSNERNTKIPLQAKTIVTDSTSQLLKHCYLMRKDIFRWSIVQLKLVASSSNLANWTLLDHTGSADMETGNGWYMASKTSWNGHHKMVKPAKPSKCIRKHPLFFIVTLCLLCCLVFSPLLACYAMSASLSFLSQFLYCYLSWEWLSVTVLKIKIKLRGGGSGHKQKKTSCVLNTETLNL